ncbi:CRISPR-associated protein Cas4 [Haloimpatiens sp. FM7330]|uniref:CRISPR-associated protein Cas4 n=1 Tax=Haloimpatiens sp. FM7330 TaxID=3298610 RepID=UPI003642F164
MEVNGTLIWFYNICKREVWLMARGIVPDQNDENVDLGKFMHEHSYKRNEKEITFGNVKFDILFKSKDKLVIGENKKSSKYNEASKWQLLYYLKVLKKAGVNAEGVLVYPNERKRVEIKMDEKSEMKLDKMVDDIEQLSILSKPPKVEKIPFCKKCAYREFCYA